MLAVMPWNFPLWQVIRMGVPTLLAGNGVLLKHAPNCFGSALLLEELVSKDLLPPDLFRSLIVDVEQVNRVMEHPKVQGVALTGSEQAGRKVAAKAGGLLKKAGQGSCLLSIKEYIYCILGYISYLRCKQTGIVVYLCKSYLHLLL